MSSREFAGDEDGLLAALLFLKEDLGRFRSDGLCDACGEPGVYARLRGRHMPFCERCVLNRALDAQTTSNHLAAEGVAPPPLDLIPGVAASSKNLEAILAAIGINGFGKLVGEDDAPAVDIRTMSGTAPSVMSLRP